MRRSRAFGFAVVIGVSAFGCEDDPAPAPSGIDGGGVSLPDGGGAPTDSGGPGPDASSDAGSDSGADAGSDGGATPKPGDIFVNATTGSDANTGLAGSPVKTITKAVGLATAPKAIWLEDGTWDGIIDPALAATTGGGCAQGGSAGLFVPAGVAVRAVHAGSAVVRLSGSFGFCMNGSELAGLRLERVEAGGTIVEVLAGANDLTGVALAGTIVPATGASSGGASPLVHLRAGAKATMRPGGLTSYTSVVGNAVFVEGAGAELTVEGGAFDDARAPSGAALRTGSGAKLVLRDVLVRRTNVTAYATSGLDVCSTCTVEVRGASRVEGFTNEYGIRVATGGALVLADTATVTGNVHGIFVTGPGASPATVTLSGASVVKGNTQEGVRGDFVSGHVLDFKTTGTPKIENNGGAGVLLTAGSAVLDGGSFTGNATGIQIGGTVPVTMRNVNVTMSGGTAGVILGTTGNIDLGTTASPGNNLLKQNVGTNLLLSSAVTTAVTAVGNTWNPNDQSASAAGTFAGNVLVNGPTSGANFTLQGAATLRLAGP